MTGRLCCCPILQDHCIGCTSHGTDISVAEGRNPGIVRERVQKIYFEERHDVREEAKHVVK